MLSLAGSGAAIVLQCRYQTWDDLLARHDGDAQKAKSEFDACIDAGDWEEHAGVRFVMVDCVTKPQPAAAATSQPLWAEAGFDSGVDDCGQVAVR